MKIYRFDPRSCIYQGEDFCDAREVSVDEGITIKAPPLPVKGHVPVFDRETHTWKLVEREIVRSRIRDACE